jgi:prepilin-type N-terminal cleavage/methylation domain-containing protein
MTTRLTRRAFTLAELLVVMAIMSLLMAILWPGITKATEFVRRTKTVNDMKAIEIALNCFKRDFGFYPPSRPYLASDPNSGVMDSGAGNLVYYLAGPGGAGWGTGNGGAMPVVGARAVRYYPPYFSPEGSKLVYRSNKVAGFLDAMVPAGEINGALMGRILYFRANTINPTFDATDNPLDAQYAIEGFASQVQFDLTLTDLVATYDQPGPGGEEFASKPYLLISPWRDRRYGYVKVAVVAGEASLVPATTTTDATCDDITNFNY